MTDITEAQKKELLKIPEFKLIRQQYMKEQKMAGAGKRKMKGRGFWEDVGNWFYNAGQNVNNFLKSTKLISNVAGAVLPILAPMATALLTLNPLASAASVGAAKATAEGIKALGYGSKMRGGRQFTDAELQRIKEIREKISAPFGRRITGTGLTMQSNGLIVNQKGGRTMQEDAQAIARGIVGMKIRGGDARLAIVPPQMRLQGKGLTMQSNGLIVNQKGGRKMKGRGAGTEYGTVSSAFGEIVM
jgi:hypothetical protein